MCVIQILAGDSEIWDRKDWNDDSRTPAISHYLVPTQVGSSGSLLLPNRQHKMVLQVTYIPLGHLHRVT